MNSQSSISVVCPTFNSEKFIEATLETVVNQTLLPDELIVSDDGSIDNTLKVVKKFLTKKASGLNWIIIENYHSGPGAARNAGIDVATGEFIAFLDSDDLWDKNKLHKCLEIIAKHPSGNIFSHYERLTLPDGKIKELKHGSNLSLSKSIVTQLYRANRFSTSALICQKKMIQKWGGFDEKLNSAQDYELWLRMSPDAKPVIIPDVLGEYIHRSGNITSGKILKRFKNEIDIAFRHRHKVKSYDIIIRVFRVILSYLRQFIHRIFV